MNWEQRELGSALRWVVSAITTDVHFGWAARIFRPKETKVFPSEQEAKEWAEARMNEIKKEFILSLIVKWSEDSYMFGNDVMQIIGGYDGEDKWTVYGIKFTHLFQGTLEECKNYIVECF